MIRFIEVCKIDVIIKKKKISYIQKIITKFVLLHKAKLKEKNILLKVCFLNIFNTVSVQIRVAGMIKKLPFW